MSSKNKIAKICSNYLLTIITPNPSPSWNSTVSPHFFHTKPSLEPPPPGPSQGSPPPRCQWTFGLHGFLRNAAVMEPMVTSPRISKRTKPGTNGFRSRRFFPTQKCFFQTHAEEKGAAMLFVWHQLKSSDVAVAFFFACSKKMWFWHDDGRVSLTFLVSIFFLELLAAVWGHLKQWERTQEEKTEIRCHRHAAISRSP